MDAAGLLKFLRTYRLAVQASVSATNAPQAAVIGYAVTDRFELVFDTLESSRKGQNLRRNHRIALVIGGVIDGEERTVQYEGIADEPSGAELEALKQVYYTAWPDGPSRLPWPGLTYVRVTPTWIRFSDFGANPPTIIEFTRDQLVGAI
jgi:hypothetical protein